MSGCQCAVEAPQRYRHLGARLTFCEGFVSRFRIRVDAGTTAVLIESAGHRNNPEAVLPLSGLGTGSALSASCH